MGRVVAAAWVGLIALVLSLNARGDWLATTRNADGSYSSASDTATVVQSTSEAVRTLRAIGRANEVGQAETYLASVKHHGTEYLSRQLIALVDAGAPTQPAITELLTHQNIDGGFGEFGGYESSSLDTAFALNALYNAGQVNTTQTLAALNFLASKQGAGGGWSIGWNDPDTVSTANALIAIWPYRQLLPAAATSYTNARAFLLAQRHIDGLWGSDFESALALIALAPTQARDGELAASVDALRTHQRADGSWGSDVYTTALALRAIAAASVAHANPDLAFVAGHIADGGSGAALSGVSVALSGPASLTRTTSVDGAFGFANLSAGTYVLTVAAVGYPALTASLKLALGQSLDLGVINLLHENVPSTARIEGHVVDTSGVDLSGVTIAVTGQSSIQTDATGRYVVNRVAPGAVTIVASREGYFTAQGVTTLIAGSTVNFSPVLRPVLSTGFNIVATFNDSVTQQPLAGVRLRVSGSANVEATSNAEGKIALSSLTPGAVNIEMTLSGYASKTAVVTVNGGQTLNLPTSLTAIEAAAPETFVIRGRITDAASGAAVPNASVILSGVTDASTQSDATGAYEFVGVTPGAFTIQVTASGYKDARAATTADAYQEIEFSPGLVAANEQPTGVHGLVVDGTTGAPIENAKVTISAGNSVVLALTQPGGEFLVRNLPAGPTSIALEAPGYLPRSLSVDLMSGFINDFGSFPLIAENNTDSLTLFGKVVDSTNNHVLIGATVVATTSNGTQVVSSDSNGQFQLSAASGQVLSLQVSNPAYLTSTFDLILTSEMADLGQVRLRPQGLDVLLPDLVVMSVDGANVSSSPDMYQMSGRASVLVQNKGYAAIPANVELVAFEDLNHNGTLEAEEPQLGRATLSAELPAGSSRSVPIDITGTARFRDAPITVYADAAQTLIERTRTNNFAVSAGRCTALPPAASALDPVVKWTWRGSPQRPTDNHVFGPVLVGQMTDDNGDGRINASDVPDLIFSTRGQSLTIISGDDGHTIFQSAPNMITGFGSGAIADIDGDGKNEIVFSNGPRTSLLAFENDGTLKWQAPNGPTHPDTTRDGITIADLNADGMPEIITGRRVYSNTGQLLWEGTQDYGGTVSYGTIPIAADINRDGTMEVIAGRTAYRANGTVLWHQSAAAADGFNAVGNFDSDDYPEIVLVASGRVYLFNHTGTTVWGPVTLSGANDKGGAPTVGDFDGDGQPEIGIAGATYYTVLETDGSLKWRQPINDTSSSVTGSSLFDFDGDGRIELVYADETNLFIFDGATGNTLYVTPNGSGTTLEYPVVADVDGDGRAELIVAGNNDASQGIRVFEGGQGEWMPTRAIWNQSAYHVTNINDDGSVPAVEPPSWLDHNTYRANTAIQRAAEPVSDLSAGNLRLIDHGIGQPSTLSVRIGNAGAALQIGIASVAFYDGPPAASGRLLGSVAIPALATGAFADVQLEGLNAISATSTLFAVADSTRRVTECNESNNIASTLGRPTVGSISVLTDSGIYSPGQRVRIEATARNAGLFTSNYRVTLKVKDANGSVIASLPAPDVTALVSGDSRMLQTTFETMGLLAGSYSVAGQLFDTAGQSLANATTSFEVRHDPAQGPAASLRLTTDRPTYHTSARVTIDSLASNLTTSTLVRDAQVSLHVVGPTGTVLLDEVLRIGDLVPGAMRDQSRTLLLSGSTEGVYNASATLTDIAGATLATASTTFKVISDPVVAVTGFVSISATMIVAGQPLSCLRTITNRGSVDLAGVHVRYSIVHLDDGAVAEQHEATLAIAAGASQPVSNAVSTGLLVKGDYACALQANLAGVWRDLAYATFKVTGPQINIDASLKLGTRGRVLVLLDDAPEYPCRPVRSIELWSPFHSRLPADAQVEVELRDSDGQLVDREAVSLSNYHGVVDRGRGRARVNLTITGVSADVLTVQVDSANSLGVGYRIVTTASAASMPPLVIDSGSMGDQCGWPIGIRAHFGDFESSRFELAPHVSMPLPVVQLPMLEAQRTFLEQLLTSAGWSYMIVTDGEAFEFEMKSGAYSEYLLLAAREKLSEQMQKELREAVYRGDGLIDAGAHDQRHHGFDEALGIRWKGRQPHVTAVNLADSPLGTANSVPLVLDHHVQRIELAGATAAGQYQGANNLGTAVSLYKYGEGRSVFVGYDVLAEATQAGAASVNAALLLNALEYAKPALTDLRAGQVIPLELSLRNAGVATPVRVTMPLPSGVTLVDAGGAHVESNVLSWTLDLPKDGQRSVVSWIRLGDQAGLTQFIANVQTGLNGPFVDYKQLKLAVSSGARSTLAETRALASGDPRLLKVNRWLDMAQRWLDRGSPAFVLGSLLQATDELTTTTDPSRIDLRLKIDQVIWSISLSVSEHR